MIIPLLTIALFVGLIAGGDDSLSAPKGAGSNNLTTSANRPQDGANGAQDGAKRPQDGAATAASEVGKTKPQVPPPEAPAPTELEVTDLVTGTGAEAKEGDVVTVHYVVLRQKDGKEVYSSWGSKPLSFELGGGGGNVTAGWEQGIKGMREGGRRQLHAPADLSYGKAGVPPEIGPNEALVSVIDLLEVKEPAPARGPAPSP